MRVNQKKSALDDFRQALKELSDVEKARSLQRFFKTGSGEYGEGDRFLGITVPILRRAAKQHEPFLETSNLSALLASVWHEERLAALLVLIVKYQRADSASNQKALFRFYAKHSRGINNWDLVDLSAPFISGHFLFHFPAERGKLFEWVKSKNLWLRRIAVVSTSYFIRQGEFNETLQLAELLLNDTHDLMHKAVGWMLREVGKRNQVIEEIFLEKHYRAMPRTMLRYAIERFPEAKRKRYLKKLD